VKRKQPSARCGDQSLPLVLRRSSVKLRIQLGLSKYFAIAIRRICCARERLHALRATRI
jgi:hypothetical protein